MRKILLGAALLLAAQVPAQAADVTILGAPGALDQNGGTNFILAFAPMQWVYTGTSFGTEAVRINSLSFRYDQIVSRSNYGNEFSWTTDPSFYLRLGVVSDLGSDVQAENRNASLTTVLAGVKTFPIFIGADQNETKPWGITFTFDTPFDYDPSLGNLLVDANIVRGPEIPNLPGVYFPTTADAIYADPAYGRGIAPASATNHYWYNLPVARFSVSDIPPVPGNGPGTALPGVPEPASWALMIGGFGMVGGAMRRRETRSALARA
jgi:hypothetical protein